MTPFLVVLAVFAALALVLLARGAIRSNPMLKEIRLHSEKMKELQLSGQKQEILKEEGAFNKRMRELAESDHGSSMPGGFF